MSPFRSRLARVGAPRAGATLALGTALLGPSVVLPIGLAGCQESGSPSGPPPAESVPLTGVRTTVVQQPDGLFLLDAEEIVDGPGELVVVRRDSLTQRETREQVRDPAQFAALLPPAPPSADTLRGAGASWDSPSAPADTAAVRERRGLPLGNLLLGTLLYQAWRPAGYGRPGYTLPAQAITGRQTREERDRTSSGFAAAGRRGTVATPDRIQRARSVRASRPSGGRSGAFRSGGRAGG